jgi:hypothetical protein
MDNGECEPVALNRIRNCVAVWTGMPFVEQKTQFGLLTSMLGGRLPAHEGLRHGAPCSRTAPELDVWFFVR